MFKNPIILCSTLCKHCVELVDLMQSNLKVFEDWIVINIDTDTTTGKRPQAYYDIQNIFDKGISSVPTIIVEEGKKLLSGIDAFNYINELLAPKGIVGQGSLNQFSSIGENSCILSDEEIRSASSKFGSKRDISSNYEKLMQERQKENKSSSGPVRQLSPPIKISM